MNEDIRLNKYIAECGICSRREADKLIADKRVTLNGEYPQPGDRVSAGDVVCVDDKEIKPLAKKVVLAYYKPPGVTVSEADPHAE